MQLPLILTLKINYEAQELFNRLRIRHFPPHRNYLDAHLSLFHQLPPNEHVITDEIAAVCDRFEAFTIRVTHVTSIGNGVAYKCESPELQQLHRHLQTKWKQWLIPQDTKRLWPHITIQNKVDLSRAKQLLEELSTGFEPFEIRGIGLSLWEYKGGPWEFVQDMPLRMGKVEL